MTAIEHLRNYARQIRDLRRADPAASEPALAPRFQQLVEALLPLLPTAPQLTVVPEFTNPGVGRPDIALKRQGEPARAFIELKAPAKSADPGQWTVPHDRRQRERLKELSVWSASNFAEFRLFHRDQAQGHATIVPASALAPETPDNVANQQIGDSDPSAFLQLLSTLASADAPAAANAEQLAELLAHSARIVRSAVAERVGELHQTGPANHPLMLVRDAFRNVLFAHPEAGGYPNADFDTLFSSAFAQALAFGLLLAREASDQPVDENAWQHMPEEHPLMRAALRVLSEEEVTREIGIGFAVMCDTVNSFAPEIMAIQPDGRDPILYFYEDFLRTFDPDMRDKYGVYYTPIQVVRYMVGALDRVLRNNLGTSGLADQNVTILDPATGTGTFLLGIAERVREQVMADEGGIAASMALGELASRMFGFELLVGPYAVAHYRLHHALRFRPPDEGEEEPQPVNLPRLGIYLADTLAPPGAAAPMGALGIAGIPIDDERAQANHVKSAQPILAIIGNPPYRRLEEGENESLVGQWMDGVWDDLKAPVRDAGKGGQLNTFPEFSVAFWRWAIWKLFESDNAPGRGVIALISNRKFLTGWPYAGLRKMMRERFDRIEVIDLRGDVRTGTRGDVADDQGVFNIMVGTAITLCIADGSKAEGALADVTYLDSWDEELFNRNTKLGWLQGGAEQGTLPNAVTVDRDALDDMRPAPFQDGEWLSLRETFLFSLSGIQTKRDKFSYAASRPVLQARIENFVHTAADVTDIFAPTTARPIASAKAALAEMLSTEEALPLIQSGYRPLDTRWLCNLAVCIDRPRPQLQSAWGQNNYGLYTMPFGVGSGPAAWCYGLLPDYHAFSGRGGYAFPLYDRRGGPDADNLNPALVAALVETYGQAVSAADIFDAMLCLLSASSYSINFAEDLEDTFPHIPFPADPADFARASAIGREIRAVETFARQPGPQFRPANFCRIAAEPPAGTEIGDIVYADGALSLWQENGLAVTAFTGLPEAVWSFSVSGYRVLPRWTEGRKGLPVTLALMRELRDVAARIAELIHWFGEADLVLTATLQNSLTREELGFPAEQPEEIEEGDD